MVTVVTDFLGLLPIEEASSMGMLLPYMVTTGISVVMAGMVFKGLVELVRIFTPGRWV